jgi:hypothetical protein
MFDDLRYRWALKKYLKDYSHMVRAIQEMPDDQPASDEPRHKYAMGKALGLHTRAIDQFRSNYLVDQAYKYHVPIPSDEECWRQPSGTGGAYLTAEAAQKLRADIRVEQKAGWDYWAGRVTLG